MPVALEPLIVPDNGMLLPVSGIGIFTVFVVPVKACPVIPVIACVPLIAPTACVPGDIVPVNGMPCPCPEKTGAGGAGCIVPVKACPANAGLATDKAKTAMITAKTCLFTLLHILYHPLFFHL
jgi:hypothetical protein